MQGLLKTRQLITLYNQGKPKYCLERFAKSKCYFHLKKRSRTASESRRISSTL